MVAATFTVKAAAKELGISASLVYVLSLTDLLGAASKLAQLNGRLVEMYLVVAVAYLVISSAASQCVATLRKRYAIATAR